MDLINKRCVPCEGGIPAFNKDEIEKNLKETPGWKAAKIDNIDKI